MSGFPAPPNQQHQPPQPRQQFAPPPGGTGVSGRFAPPPPAPGGGGRFAPPPPPPAAATGVSSGFAPPPPPAAPGGGSFAHQPVAPGGYHAQPPPPQQQPMQQLNHTMGNMSMQQQQQQQQPRPQGQPGMGFGPPPPAGGGPPPAAAATPSMMMMPPHVPPPGGGGTGFAPPPPGGGGSGFAPPFPGSGSGGGFAPPPPQPGMMTTTTTPGNLASAMASTSSPFYHQSPTKGQMERVAQIVPGAATTAAPIPQGGVAGAGGTNFTNDNIDYSVTIPERLFRWTAGKLPQTANMANATKIPLGAVLRPLAPDGESDTPVDTVLPGTAGIVRCKRCRTYINAFVTWSEHGRRWRCNICGQINDCPSAYFCHLDEMGLRRDRYERPELCRAVVEFVAPPEYMVRPPQEPTYFFVLDVSATSVRSGMLACAAQAIKASLDDLPGRGRTKIGFITFDSSVHYFNLSPELASPQMLVVSDLKELFVPLPDNLLVNLEESRKVVEAFLDSLPEMFVKNPVVSQSCLGPALKAAFTVMKQIGGKMSVFQSILPTLGDGALKPREQPAIMGTPNEVKLLKPEITWYKDTAIEFSRQQISVDLFIFPYQYMDLATLGELAKLTAGSMHSYVNFNAAKDGARFEAQLNKSLTQTTAFEAVMRIRCTKGMRITNFYGNFYIRGTDLLALPNCNTDSVFGFDLAHDEPNVTATHVTIQAALLYTSGDGERRIRVTTQALPVTSLASEVVASIDTDACCALLAKQALDVATKSSLDNARMRLQQICIEIIRAAKGGDKRTVSGYSVPPLPGQLGGGGGGGEADEKPIPDNLQLLPLYTLAMMKNVAFRGGTDVHPDERVQSHYLLNSMWVEDSKHFVYPRMFSIHDMDANAGYPITEGQDDKVLDGDKVAGRSRIQLPAVVNLSVDRLTSNGVFLLDNGVEMYLWVGRTADMNVVGSLFGVHSLDEIDPQQIAVLTSGDALATRFGAITQALRESDADPYVIPPKINVVREGDTHMEARFFWFMIEDRASFQGGTHSYPEFMQFVNNPQASAGAAGPLPPGGVRPHGAPMGPPASPGGIMQRGGMPPPPPHQVVGMQPQKGMGMPPPPQQQQQHGMGMPPPQQQQQHGMGMPPPQQQQQQFGMGMPPPQQQQHGMGMPPPQQQQHGMPPPQQQQHGMPPPPQQQHGMGSGRPPNQGMPQPNQGMPPASQRMPPPLPGRAMPQPQQQNVGTGPPPPPQPGLRGSTPPGPPHQANGGHHSAPGGPPSGGFGGPPSQGPPSGGFGGPPQRAPAAPGPPPPQRNLPPPPPPRGSMFPPPPR